jgi:proteic killer suppression protein
MIASFRDGWLEAYFDRDERGKRIPADLADSLFRKLQLIDDATSDADLRVPSGNRFERLQGHLSDYHSIRVNQRWRLVFRWDAALGKAHYLYLDEHSYR